MIRVQNKAYMPLKISYIRAYPLPNFQPLKSDRVKVPCKQPNLFILTCKGWLVVVSMIPLEYPPWPLLAGSANMGEIHDLLASLGLPCRHGI